MILGGPLSATTLPRIGYAGQSLQLNANEPSVYMWS